MANMSLKKNEMPSQDPNVRNKNSWRSLWVIPRSRRWMKLPAA